MALLVLPLTRRGGMAPLCTRGRAIVRGNPSWTNAGALPALEVLFRTYGVRRDGLVRR